MNFIYRIGIGSIACIAVACSKDATETAAPVAEPETVIIGCAGATGADVDVRTQLENDGLSVRWSQGDEIRLWAREHKEPADASPTYVIENVPFRFYYYSPSWSRAGFKGTINGVESTFNAAEYDYFAVSPAPASDADVDAPADGSHINVTYTIPAVQTGEFDGRYDIMTAKPLTAQGLQAGDDNPSVNLVFKHHVHVLKIVISENELKTLNSPNDEEGIRSIELTFPDPVTGKLTVDATGRNEPAFTPADGDGGKVLTLNFKEPKKKGDVVYAFIARQEPLSGDGKVIIKATGASGGDKPCVSLERSFTKTREFMRGAVTTLEYNIPERYRCTKIFFSLAEKEGGEKPDRKITEANAETEGWGWGTLGEPIESFQVVGEDGTTVLYDCPEAKCDHVNNKYELASCVAEGDHEAFIAQYVGKPCIVKLISAHAVVEYPFTFPTLEQEVENTVRLEVPYLFEEDFSNVTTHDHNGDEGVDVSNTGHTGHTSFDDYGLIGWTGARMGVESGTKDGNSYGAARICCRNEYGGVGKASVHGTYHGRMDSPALLMLTNQTAIEVSFKYGFGRQSNKDDYSIAPYLAFGITKEEDKDAPSGTGSDGYKSMINGLQKIGSGELNGSFENIPLSLPNTWIKCSDCTKDHRLVWEVYMKDKEKDEAFVKNHNTNNWAYIDNVKVRISHQK